MICHICGSESNKVFSANVLNKYSVGYHQCVNCKFIQTDQPYWLNEAYSSAISSLDVGLVSRNLYFLELVTPIITKHFDYKASFLDYAGGYGLFVRMMRDKGFHFYRQDPYCENLFAEHFDYTNLPPDTTFELLTAFEVFEHLVNPLEEVSKMLKLSDSVLFSTVLQPQTSFKTADDWWYFVPESGQHVGFYTYKALEVLAERFNCHLYSNQENLHLFTRKKLKSNPFASDKNNFTAPSRNLLYRSVSKMLRFIDSRPDKPVPVPTPQLDSLTVKDWEFVKEKVYGQPDSIK